MILAQVRAVVQDIGVDAVKVGMLGSVRAVAGGGAALDELPAGTPMVVDPVMVAESGARLLELDAERALVEEILPRATVVTPNVPEARALAGAQTTAPEDGAAGEDDLALAIKRLGPAAVVVTGGHRTQAADIFYDGDVLVPIPGERHPDGAAHGSGCTHSSVLAARLALGDTPLEAAREARAAGGRGSGVADCAMWAVGRGRLTCSDSRAFAPERARSAPETRAPAFAIIRSDEAAATQAGTW